MNRLLLIIIFVFIGAAASAQQKIGILDVPQHIGDSVTLTAKVYSARYFETSNRQPTLLNIGAAFPNQLLTVVIYGDNLQYFKEAPVTLFNNKTVTVTGKIELYRGKPQIVVKDNTGIMLAAEQ